MPQYRIEISPNNRAGCHEAACKKQVVKIQKGEIRFGSWVEIKEHGSWSWKHWGCVSGRQIAGLQESCGGDPDNYDFDAIDGYDELEDDEIKEKIQRCIKQGHIDPEDFKGDPEKNKLGEKGIFLNAKQKAAKEKAAAEASDADEAPAKKSGKGGRKKAAKDVDDGPKAKKAGKPKRVEADEEEPKAKSKSKAKAKSASEGDAEEPAATKKLPKRGSKAKPVKPEEETVDEDKSQEKEDVAPVKATRGRKASASKARTETGTADEDEGAEKAVPASAPRGRKRASMSQPDDKDEEAATPAAKRGRKSSVAATKAAPGDEEAKAAPKARGRGRPRKSDVAAN
ncbi:hypothetical protein MKX08_006213 [Trichoderma sp. CBMAI-0020]|nr:hypothetical protein MKX08_006213 [Trichoderma sp. CBMAI-0020]